MSPARRDRAPRAGADRGKLATYQRKRDFDRTPEPAGQPTDAGADTDAGGQRRFVVQRHRARRLHYDLRFEIGGVLVSWAVPKGPTLDPNVRRIAIHVEDHPIEYLNFEGVIPAGGYGGGDVIVWDRGTWEPHETDDPAGAVAAGEFHVDVTGEKLRGRFILVRTGPAEAAGKEQWLLLHKHDDDAVPGWNPEDYPRSVLSGRTNDEVKADPERMWRSDLPPSEASVAVGRGGSTAAARPRRAPKPKPSPLELRPDRYADALSQLDALGSNGALDVFGRRLKLTNLDKELFPGRPGEAPVTKRELIRYAIQVGPVILPYLAGRALNMHRFPGGAQASGFWHKQLPEHAPDWVGRWENPEAKRGHTSTYLVVDEPAALVWAANFGALEWHAWTAPTDRPDQPSYALIDIDPGTETSWEDVLVLARLHRAGARAPGRAGPAQAHRPARRADLDPGRARPVVRGHPDLGRAAVQVRRVRRARPGQLEVGRPRPGRAGPPRLHPERQPQDPRRALQPARRGGRADLRAPGVGRARRPGTAAGLGHHPDRHGPAERARRPVPGAAQRTAGAAADPLAAAVWLARC